jgi:hypothetical protein
MWGIAPASTSGPRWVNVGKKLANPITNLAENPQPFGMVQRRIENCKLQNEN